MATTKTATPAKKVAAKPAHEGIVAYCTTTKEKNVPMLKAVINIKSGRYIATGVDAKNNKMAAIMSRATAEAAIKNGHAKGGDGFKK